MHVPLSSQQQKSYDEQWYERLKTLDFEDYEKLTGSAEVRQREEERFFSGAVRNPALDYPLLQSFPFAIKAKALNQLLSEITRHEPVQAVRELYEARIHEILLKIRMLSATKEKNDEEFFTQSVAIYKTPQVEDISYILSRVCARARKKRETGDFEQKVAAERLLTLFSAARPEVEKAVARSVLPKGEAIGERITSANEVKKAIEAELSRLMIPDWTVKVDESGDVRSFSVSQEYKQVIVPSSKILLSRQMSERKLRGLIAHEIGTHVLRRYRGRRSRLRLLGLGLAGYLRGDEGVATFHEQLITGARDFAGIARYFSVMVATGVDGIQRDFRDTFEVMKDFRLLYRKAAPQRAEKVASLAYNDCVRIFRGTTACSPGKVFLRDMAYFANREIWQLYTDCPMSRTLFTVGKFDPTNKQHLEALATLGIIEKKEKESGHHCYQALGAS